MSTQVLQSETGGAEGQFWFRDVDTPRRIRSGDSGKASRQGMTLCSALPHLASRLSAILKFGAGTGVDPFAKVKGFITELISRLQEEASSEASQNAVQPVRVRFNRVACEIVLQSLHPETGASTHVERVIAAAVLICIFTSTCEVLQMEYGHTGNFLLSWCERVCWRWSMLRGNLRTLVQLVVGLGFPPSTTKDVDHEALWLAFVIKVLFLDQSCRQQYCVSAFEIRTLAHRCTRSV